MKTSGNTMLITGGGSGIGRELALRFNALGNTVIVTGRRVETLEETIAGQRDMHAIVVDVEDPKAITAFAERVVAEYPNLNVLINNAGIMRREDLSRTRDLSGAEQAVVANLLGPIRLRTNRPYGKPARRGDRERLLGVSVCAVKRHAHL